MQPDLRHLRRTVLASAFAYANEADAPPAELGVLEKRWFFGGERERNVAAVLLDRPGVRLLAFQGTTLPSRNDAEKNIRFLRDWLDNFRFALKRHQLDLPGKTHQGFARQLGLLWPAIEPVLRASNTPVQITGHSQGGAIALLATKAAERSGLWLEPTITFGAPRAADDEFVKALNTEVWRIEHDNDVVPFVPPRLSAWNGAMVRNLSESLPPLFRDFVNKLVAIGDEAGLEYRAAGKLWYLRPGRSPISQLSDWEQLQRLMRMMIAGRELVDDHYVESYVRAINAVTD